MKPSDPSRVVESHALARAAFRAAGAFGLIAAAWAVLVLVRGGSWWGPLHSFLAGTVLLAISGASQMFTITWAAAPAPSRRLTALQRWLAIVGVGLVLLGVSSSTGWLAWPGAVMVAGALALLGWSVLRSVRRSLLRRFDLSSRFYLVAFVSGIVGVTLGGVMSGTETGASFDTLRQVHSRLNLVGFVGLTIVGTLPTFLPTVAHHRAVSGREAIGAWWASVVAAGTMMAGLAEPRLVGAGTLLIAAAGAAVLVGIVVRLWEKGRHKLTFLQITAGSLWLIGWAALDGIDHLGNSTTAPFGRWTALVVVAGVGQILAGSFAYLLPVLKGHPSTRNAALMTDRMWLPLVAANVAGVALLVGLPQLALAAAVVWVIDFAVRLALLRTPKPT